MNLKVHGYLRIIYENTNKWKVSPADLYEGAYAVISTKDSNPDWIAQSAHSLREISYLLIRNKDVDEKKVVVKEAFETFVDDVFSDETSANFTLLDKVFNKIAHHDSLKAVKKKLGEKGIEVDSGRFITERQFFQILNFVDKVLLETLPLQIKSHKEIDDLVKQNANECSIGKVRYMIGINADTKDYLFEKLTPEWIGWLHKNGFFETLNQAAMDKTGYSFKTPELGYLEGVVKEKPDEVTKVMLEVDPVTNYNPEVIDRFTRITESLSGDNLTKMVKKIHDENWVFLMRKFNSWGHTYKKIGENLAQGGDAKGLIQLADVLMTVDAERDAIRSNPFVVSYLSEVGVLQALVDLEGDDAKEAYEFLITKLAEIIGKGEREDADTQVFKIEEPYYFFDVDLFNHGFDEKHSRSYRDDMENYMAAVALLTKKLFDDACGNEVLLKELYTHLDTKMPDSWTGWRLRLYTASFCGELFREPLQTMFSQLFEVMKEGKSYYEIESGTEYKKALAASWPELDYEFKEQFIENIFTYFDPDRSEGEQKNWRTRDALQILKMVQDHLDVSVEERARTMFGESYKSDRVPEPRPTITQGKFREIVERSPVDLSKKEVSDIPQLLKTVLSPEEVEKKYEGDSFHNPRNVEGAGGALREDVQKEERIDKYLEIIDQFFVPGEIHPHYTSSVLQGVEYLLRDKKTFSEELWKKLFGVIEAIEKADLLDAEEGEKNYLATWRSIRRTNADLLKYTLDKDFLSDAVYKEYRPRILEVIVSLLGCDDPKPEHETGKYGDLRTVAINHTQGVAYQAYIQFLYKDGEKLQSDTKIVFTNLLKTNTSLSTRAMIGQYLPSIYFRDIDWVKGQLPIIFNVEDSERFFAAWEGYVMASVYKEIFEAMRSYYLFAMDVREDGYPEGKNRGDNFDRAIGVHLALAYTHFPEVTLEDDLIKALWESGDSKKQSEFISHIGRGIISSNHTPPDAAQKKKIIAVWDWLLEQPVEGIASEVYGEFGLWITEKNEDDIIATSELVDRFAKILELSKGRLDYEYHLKDKLKTFAKSNPQGVLSILRSLLLTDVATNADRMWMRTDVARVEVFEILYRAEKDATAELINELIEKRGRVFWGLKSVLV